MGFRDVAAACRTLYCQNESVLLLSLCCLVNRGHREQQIMFTTEEGAFFSFVKFFFLHYLIAAVSIKLVQAMPAGDTGEQVYV